MKYFDTLLGFHCKYKISFCQDIKEWGLENLIPKMFSYSVKKNRHEKTDVIVVPFPFKASLVEVGFVFFFLILREKNPFFLDLL